MSPVDLDQRVRLAAFEWLRAQVDLHGDDVLPRGLLAEGFDFEGVRVPLLGPQGIFKPRLLPDIPLSITTAPRGPYDDSISEDGLLRYRYRGKDPQHRDNVGLRSALWQKRPLVYFHGIEPGRYLAQWPVFIVGDDPRELTFTVAVDARELAEPGQAEEWAHLRVDDPETHYRRVYMTSEVRRRLHQQDFRGRVLRAYRNHCALCRLRHEELLDAAHIIPDTEPGGEPVVSNGLALCKLHHAAFDRMFLGVRPDYIVQVRRDVLEEEDGPMLLHGLQGMHGSRIILPRAKSDRPDPDRLASRYEKFRAAG